MARLYALRGIGPGALLALTLALVARVTSEKIGGLLLESASSPISPVLCAVLIGILWRNVVGISLRTEAGLEWVTSTLLRIGIALVGLRLTFDGLASVGVLAAPVVAVCIVVVATTIFLLGRALRIPPALQVLIGAGTAICGCTAIVATAPVIRARPAEVGLALSCIVLFGCLGMLIYPWIANEVFGADATAAGIFLGTSIHDTSQVVGASLIHAQQFGEPQIVATASATKFLRNVFIVVLVPLAAAWANRSIRKDEASPEASSVREMPLLSQAQVIPGFVVAFVAMVVVRSMGDHVFEGSTAGDSWHHVVSAAQSGSEVLLAWGMTAVGLSISLSQMRHLGWRPALAAFITAAGAGLCSLGLTWYLA